MASPVAVAAPPEAPGAAAGVPQQELPADASPAEAGSAALTEEAAAAADTAAAAAPALLAPADGAGDGPPMSKNALKRQAKLQRYEEKRVARKEHEKQARHESMRRRREEWAATMADRTPGMHACAPLRPNPSFHLPCSARVIMDLGSSDAWGFRAQGSGLRAQDSGLGARSAGRRARRLAVGAFPHSLMGKDSGGMEPPPASPISLLFPLPASEEREAMLAQKLDVRAARRQESEDRRDRRRASLDAGQNFVIDLGFAELMQPGELKSLSQQVMYCYASNSKAPVPARLSLTSCGGPVLRQLERLSGFERWSLHRSEKSYMEVFESRHGDLVYLTADSSSTVHHLESNKIYIIGGIVDRNRYKDVTLKKAQEQGIATAKLPIGEFVQLTASKVLTINQVMDILLSYLAEPDWQSAFVKAVPQRKRLSETGCNHPPAKRLQQETLSPKDSKVADSNHTEPCVTREGGTGCRGRESGSDAANLEGASAEVEASGRAQNSKEADGTQSHDTEGNTSRDGPDKDLRLATVAIKGGAIASAVQGGGLEVDDSEPQSERIKPYQLS
eukprot:SM000358S13178  [mRNA]  locus=s358:53365:56152:+ [translate_table: standard]